MNISILTAAETKKMIKRLKDKNLSLTELYDISVNELKPKVWYRSIDTLVALYGSDDDWEQLGLDEEHWYVGDAHDALETNEVIDKDNTGGQCYSKDEFILMLEKHLMFLKR